jgi:hypothetical protein
MSSTVQHKLSELEVSPPEGCWQKIAAELDDSASGLQFPARLRAFALDPPAQLWDQISAQLDTEMMPGSIAAKLYAAEAIPPAAAWNQIRNSLDAETVTAQPRTRRLAPLLRYAAAAILIGFLAFGAIRMFGPAEKNNTTASGKSEPEKTTITLPAPVDNNLPEREDELAVTPLNDDEARNDAALEASKRTFAKLDIPSKKRVDVASQFHFSQYVNTEDISEPGLTGYEEVPFTEPDKANRYIVLMTPDGHFIRMSKKLSSLICCVSGEEEDEKCKLQVDKWRKQLAGSDASHPGNFMDILNLVGSLRDN